MPKHCCGCGAECRSSYCPRCLTKHNRQRRKLIYLLGPVPKRGRCPICGRHRRLVLDHDHTTGEYKGHICSACNKALGLLGENVITLQRAVDYLKTASLRHLHLKSRHIARKRPLRRALHEEKIAKDNYNRSLGLAPNGVTPVFTGGAKVNPDNVLITQDLQKPV